MLRMQDTAEEPSPSPSTGAEGCGTAGLGAEAAWPKPSPVPASHPTADTGKVLFLFLFLCFSHQLGTFRGWDAPFPPQHRGASLGCRAVPPQPRSVPLQLYVPCNAVTLHVPEQMMPPPLQQCPPAGTHPLSALSSPHHPWESHAGMDVRCRVASEAGGTGGASSHAPGWHRGPGLRWEPEPSTLK